MECKRKTVVCEGNDTWAVGPDGEDLCPPHAREAWSEYRLKLAAEMGIKLNPPKAKSTLAEEFTSIRWGVTFTLAGVSRPVKGGWTEDFWWPYRTHRHALGLQKKYPTHQGKLVSWGKKGSPAKVSK